jgi:hypothetical protein
MSKSSKGCTTRGTMKKLRKKLLSPQICFLVTIWQIWFLKKKVWQQNVTISENCVTFL